jgi:hypothetical protein
MDTRRACCCDCLPVIAQVRQCAQPWVEAVQVDGNPTGWLIQTTQSTQSVDGNQTETYAQMILFVRRSVVDGVFTPTDAEIRDLPLPWPNPSEIGIAPPLYGYSLVISNGDNPGNLGSMTARIRDFQPFGVHIRLDLSTNTPVPNCYNETERSYFRHSTDAGVVCFECIGTEQYFEEYVSTLLGPGSVNYENIRDNRVVEVHAGIANYAQAFGDCIDDPDVTDLGACICTKLFCSPGAGWIGGTRIVRSVSATPVFWCGNRTSPSGRFGDVLIDPSYTSRDYGQSQSAASVSARTDPAVESFMRRDPLRGCAGCGG